MLRSDFHYDLPLELIAQEPRERGRSRMMIVRPREGQPQIEHATFERFPDLITPDDVLVINDTKVFPARLFARPLRNMQRPIEVLMTRQLGPLRWECWCRPARRIRPGDRLVFSDLLGATVLAKDEGTIVVDFEPASAPDAPPHEVQSRFWEEIDAIGAPPLPPYIVREEFSENDKAAYQTVYAEKRGAVAAPTAGLHFTPEILDQVSARGTTIARLTLHVGLGTFKPVKVDDVAEHRMESEWYDVPPRSAAAINAALAEGRRIVAVGTTSVRALESAVARGEGRVLPGSAETSIFITPGFRFRAVGALLTNFHLPESTLLMLVSSFAGIETIRAAYREAIAQRYLFYSFGDCMFLASPGSW